MSSRSRFFCGSSFLAVGLLLTDECCCFAQTYEVLIEGVMSERREVNRAGQTVVVRPSEETRFDANAHLKSDPSITMSGNVTGGGFSLPLFRGPDARSSHIFVDDMELQDPFTGMPMLDDIDLRAFGTMTIHKGFAPWNLPVLDPGGVVQFTLRQARSPLEGGMSFGDVSGTSGWAKTSFSESGHDAGLYLRRSTTRGDYKYYSDNNTVLNSSDDAIRRRGNNDRSSQQVLGYGTWYGESVSARGLLWGQSSYQGISIGQASGDGSARVKADTGIVTSGVRLPLNDNYAMLLDAGHFQGRRKFSDPGADVGFATKRTLTSQSSRGRISLVSDTKKLSWLASVEEQEAATKLSSTYSEDFYAPSVSSTKLYAGARFRPVSTQTIELKTGAEWSEARVKNVSGSDQKTSKTKPTYGRSIGWSRLGDDVFSYAQAGTSARAPSLLERVGNGAEIEGSRDLVEEEARFAEIGSRGVWTFEDDLTATVNVALWGRDNARVIRVEKIAATRWRAVNGGPRSFRGVETRVDLGDAVKGLELAASWLKAEQTASHLLVPRVPVWQASGSGRYRFFDSVTVRALSRFIGRMYDDISNTRELGWTLTHDLSADYFTPGSPWKLGVAVINVTNVMSNVVRDTATGQTDGRMAYSGFNSEPLPGRAWAVSVSASL